MIEVTLPLKIPKSLSYFSPYEVRIGQRVIVPLRGRKTIGLVTALEGEEFPEIKSVEGVIDEVPLLPAKELSFLRWVADYHLAPLGQVIRYALPQGLFVLPRRRPPEPLTGPLPREAQGDGFFPILFHEEDEKRRLETYSQEIERQLSEGKMVLFLVPEKKRGEEFKPHLAAKFPQMAFYHGKLSPKKKAHLWFSVLKGEASLVVGTRSALFLPFPRLGLIIVEDEDDPAYKEEQAFRYQARDLALMKGKVFGVRVLLGSPAPSVKSSYWAWRGKYQWKKGSFKRLERIEIIDLKENRGLLSQRLINTVRLCLSRKKQVFFFLNRLGYASCLQCQDCGYLWRCPRCETPLTYHRQEEELLCRFCREKIPAPPLCPQCGGSTLKFLGTGTERLLEITQKLFPEAQIARLDRETAKDSLPFEEVDILIGTRKAGWRPPLPRLSLIAVISADQMLGLPDWRAAERTYQVLKRLSLNPVNQMLIQTFHPAHPVFQGLKEGYETFFKTEILARKRAGFPPFKRLVLFGLEDKDHERAEKLAEKAASFFEEENVEFFGPREERIKGKYLFSFLLRGKTELLHQTLRKFLQKEGLWGGIRRYLLDFDPD